jgi:hypothetical protein
VTYHLVIVPNSEAENTAIMGFPYRLGAFSARVPKDDMTGSITAQKATIVVQEVKSVYLGLVAAENISWLNRQERRVLGVKR